MLNVKSENFRFISAVPNLHQTIIISWLFSWNAASATTAEKIFLFSHITSLRSTQNTFRSWKFYMKFRYIIMVPAVRPLWDTSSKRAQLWRFWGDRFQDLVNRQPSVVHSVFYGCRNFSFSFDRFRENYLAVSIIYDRMTEEMTEYVLLYDMWTTLGETANSARHMEKNSIPILFSLLIVVRNPDFEVVCDRLVICLCPARVELSVYVSGTLCRSRLVWAFCENTEHFGTKTRTKSENRTRTKRKTIWTNFVRKSSREFWMNSNGTSRHARETDRNIASAITLVINLCPLYLASRYNAMDNPTSGQTDGNVASANSHLSHLSLSVVFRENGHNKEGYQDGTSGRARALSQSASRMCRHTAASDIQDGWAGV